MLPLNERHYQEKCAAERFINTKKQRETQQKAIRMRGVERVETTERLVTRRQLIHPFDSLAFERVLGKNDLITMNYLEFGIKAAHSVCRVHIREANGRNLGFGTGFLVSPTLLLTNHHVLESSEIAQNSLAEFNFQIDSNFLPRPTKIFRLDPLRFFYNNRELDFALVAVVPQASDNTPLVDFAFLQLIEPSGKALIDEPVSIIQHPDGADKQVALRNNHILGLSNDFIHYETDTLPGSSGSPVFNDQWIVVALHHAGVPALNGDNQILAKNGQVWTPEMGEDAIDWVANEGVRISSIVQHLQTQTEWSAAEITLLRQLNGVTLGDAGPEIVSSLGNGAKPGVIGLSQQLTKPPVLTLEQFYALVDNEGTGEKALAPYLRLNERLSGPFNPVFQLNRDLVIDTTRLESDRALPWLNRWARSRRQRRYRQKIAANPAIIKIVAEGDSWFQYPFLLEDIIDQIMDQPDLAVLCFSAAGDLLRDMISSAEYITAIEQEDPEFFLISGGGNDLVGGGRLSSLTTPFTPGRSPADYLNGAFTGFEAEIQSYYHRLFTTLTSRFPRMYILCHGYDYPVPRQGIWLGDPLRQNGIQDPELQRQIVAAMMDRVNGVIQQVAANFANVRYLNLRNTIPVNGWFDELHPQNPGFSQLANRFIATIRELHGV